MFGNLGGDGSFLNSGLNMAMRAGQQGGGNPFQNFMKMLQAAPGAPPNQPGAGGPLNPAANTNPMQNFMSMMQRFGGNGILGGMFNQRQQASPELVGPNAPQQPGLGLPPPTPTTPGPGLVGPNAPPVAPPPVAPPTPQRPRVDAKGIPFQPVMMSGMQGGQSGMIPMLRNGRPDMAGFIPTQISY